MTSQDALRVYQRYADGWNARSAEERSEIVSEVLEERLAYVTAQHRSVGREAAIGDMASFQKRFPGGRFEVGAMSAHHDVALFAWIGRAADGRVLIEGHDQIRLSPDGKIVNLITFESHA